MLMVSLSYLRFSRHRSFSTQKKHIICIRQILTLSIMFRIKYNIFFGFIFSKLIACHSLDRTQEIRFFAVSGKVKTNIWINIDPRKQLDSWDFFDIFWFWKNRIQTYTLIIFQIILNRQKLIVLCACSPSIRPAVFFC